MFACPPGPQILLCKAAFDPLGSVSSCVGLFQTRDRSLRFLRFFPAHFFLSFEVRPNGSSVPQCIDHCPQFSVICGFAEDALCSIVHLLVKMLYQPWYLPLRDALVTGSLLDLYHWLQPIKSGSSIDFFHLFFSSAVQALSLIWLRVYYEITSQALLRSR